MAKLDNYLDKIGLLGSFFASLCCIGTPAIIAFVSTIGVGFLINDKILIPLLIVSLAITILSLTLSLRKHRKPYALILCVLSSPFVYRGIWISKSYVYLGLIGIGSSI